MNLLYLAYLLIAIGLLMMAGELIIPSGFFLAVALIAVIAGITMVFIHAPDPYTPWCTLIAVFVIVPIASSILFRLWPKTAMGRRLFLHGPHEDATVASLPVNMELEQYRGRIGRALSPLRPSGVADFDGRRVDVITEGMMVDAGQWVRCIDVRTGKVIVRPVDSVNLPDLESADFG